MTWDRPASPLPGGFPTRSAPSKGGGASAPLPPQPLPRPLPGQRRPLRPPSPALLPRSSRPGPCQQRPPPPPPPPHPTGPLSRSYLPRSRIPGSGCPLPVPARRPPPPPRSNPTGPPRARDDTIGAVRNGRRRLRTTWLPPLCAVQHGGLRGSPRRCHFGPFLGHFARGFGDGDGAVPHGFRRALGRGAVVSLRVVPVQGHKSGGGAAQGSGGREEMAGGGGCTSL